MPSDKAKRVAARLMHTAGIISRYAAILDEEYPQEASVADIAFHAGYDKGWSYAKNENEVSSATNCPDTGKQGGDHG